MSELSFEQVQEMDNDKIYELFCQMYKSVHNYHPWHVKPHESEKIMSFFEYELRPDTIEWRRRQFELELF